MSRAWRWATALWLIWMPGVLGLVCSVCLPGDLVVAAGQPEWQVLGEAPLCEASAAVPAPWQPGLVLVADNEISDRLFAFRLDGDGWLTAQLPMMLPGERHAGDLEALAVADGTILAVGSHGRKGDDCRPSRKRRRIQRLTWDVTSGRLRDDGVIDSGPRWQEITASTDACLRGLFSAPPPARAAEVCAAVVEAEAAAGSGSCATLEIEGATGVPADSETGGERVWLGLRRPRWQGRAILLRLTAGLDELRFDSVVLAAVGDRGIRALASDGLSLWAILGPAPGVPDRSALWRVPLAELRPGAVVSGELVAEHLPPSSEGLVLAAGRAIIVCDGHEGRDRLGPCDEPAHQHTVNLTPSSRLAQLSADSKPSAKSGRLRFAAGSRGEETFSAASRSSGNAVGFTCNRESARLTRCCIRCCACTI